MKLALVRTKLGISKDKKATEKAEKPKKEKSEE